MSIKSAMNFIPRIVGLLPDQVTRVQADRVATEIRDAFHLKDGSTVRALRILPSSVVVRDGTIEFVVNTTVEPKSTQQGAPAERSKVIDSVVTIDRPSGDVTGVKIPFLDRAFA